MACCWWCPQANTTSRRQICAMSSLWRCGFCPCLNIPGAPCRQPGCALHLPLQRVQGLHSFSAGLHGSACSVACRRRRARGTPGPPTCPKGLSLLMLQIPNTRHPSLLRCMDACNLQQKKSTVVVLSSMSLALHNTSATVVASDSDGDSAKAISSTTCLLQLPEQPKVAGWIIVRNALLHWHTFILRAVLMKLTFFVAFCRQGYQPRKSGAAHTFREFYKQSSPVPSGAV